MGAETVDRGKLAVWKGPKKETGQPENAESTARLILDL